LTFISTGDPRSFLVVSTLLGQIENGEILYTNNTQRNKERITQRYFFSIYSVKPMNYNRLVKNFSINMQILNKKSSLA
jgi:hypothetical protein